MSVKDLAARGLLYSTDYSAVMLMEHLSSQEILTVRFNPFVTALMHMRIKALLRFGGAQSMMMVRLRSARPKQTAQPSTRAQICRVVLLTLGMIGSQLLGSTTASSIPFLCRFFPACT